MSKTPASVKVISILGIIWGAIGILGLVGSLVLIFVHIGPPNPMLDALNKDPFYIAFSLVVEMIGIFKALLLIGSSVGSLSLKPWARPGMLVYAWVAIVQVVVGAIINMAYVFPKMMAAIPASTPPALRASMQAGMIAGACGAIISIIFPICILYFFTRLHVINAFKGIFPADPTDFPVLYPEQPIPPPR
jgi:hypothetical protein